MIYCIHAKEAEEMQVKVKQKVPAVLEGHIFIIIDDLQRKSAT